MIPHVKICCISSIAEARLAIKYGASALGLVSAMPSGPGVIPEQLIAEIVSSVPPPIATFLLTSKQEAESIIQQQRRTRVNTIQICDSVTEECYKELRRVLRGVALVQVIHVQEAKSIDEARSVSPFVDALLLDSGNQSLPVKELGGTGRTHDWSISRKIREEVNVPIFLAGGLHSSNVVDAIEAVRPFAVDLCSGVRTNGRLDEQKLATFFDRINNASMART